MQEHRQIRIQSLKLALEVCCVLIRNTLLSAWFWVLLVGTYISTSEHALRLVFDSTTQLEIYPTVSVMTSVRASFFDFISLIVAIGCAGIFIRLARKMLACMSIVGDSVAIIAAFTGSILAMMIVVASMMLTAVAASVVFQYNSGITDVNISAWISVYFARVKFVNAIIYGILAVAVHALVISSKVANLIAMSLACAHMYTSYNGFYWSKYIIGWTPSWWYSDLIGFGRSLDAVHLFQKLWLIVSGVVLMVAATVLSRNIKTNSPTSKIFSIISCALLLMLALFSMSIYQKLEARAFVVDKTKNFDEKANYEVLFSQFKDEPLPVIADINLNYQLDTKSERLVINGAYVLRNRTGISINSLIVGLPFKDYVISSEVLVDGVNATVVDNAMRYYLFNLESKLLPGNSISLSFRYEYSSRGGQVGWPRLSIFENGTYASAGFMPFIGYNCSLELKNQEERQIRGLKPETTTNCHSHHSQRFTRNDSANNQVHMLITVETDLSQIVVAPGMLIGSWVIGDRRIFSYRSEINNYETPVFASASYSVKKSEWRGRSIELYYNHPQGFNAELILNVAKESLDYGEDSFGSYDYQVLRIANTGKVHLDDNGWSFHTLIFIPEHRTFIARNPLGLETLTFDIAHEVAHQWWGGKYAYQSNLVSSKIFNESLAQYTALMVFKRIYGIEKLRTYVSYLRNHYLYDRRRLGSNEHALVPTKSNPDNSQFDYDNIYYLKAALAFYALENEIGESLINHVLMRIVKEYTHSWNSGIDYSKFTDYLRQKLPPESQQLMTDFFEEVVTYDASIFSAKVCQIAMNKWLVSGLVHLQKNCSDADQAINGCPINYNIDIAVYSSSGDIISTNRLHVNSGKVPFQFIVDVIPSSVVVDPSQKFIDINFNNNTFKLPTPQP